MSRIGKIPIKLPKGIKVDIRDSHIQVTGPMGSLELDYTDTVRIKHENDEIRVEPRINDKRCRSFQGLYQRLLSNMVKGVNKGFEKELEIVGLGYRASMQGKSLILTVGYSHPVEMKPPRGITFEVPTPNKIVVKGIDKQQVGQIAANVRNVRPPEPYKGKGVRYVGEYVRRKVGKTGGK